MTARGQDFLAPGVPVSQPLQPVRLVESAAAMQVVEAPPPGMMLCHDALAEVGTGLPRRWSNYDLILWWSKSQCLPPLVVSHANASQTNYTSEHTNVLIGHGPHDPGMHTGFRFTLGRSIGNDSTFGTEAVGLFLGTNVSQVNVHDSDQQRFTNVGRPYVDALTGRSELLPVSGFQAGTGSLGVMLTTRIQGWEVNLLRHLFETDTVSVNVLGGYRYLGVFEGLHVSQSSLRFAPGAPPRALWDVYDQIDARNHFHGGQVGLSCRSAFGQWTLAFAGKVALGTNHETVQIDGRSSMKTAALPWPTTQTLIGGFLATPTNSGRLSREHFAVLPEVRMELGYQLGKQCQFFVGYDLIYLSHALRPADQLDLTIDPARSPILNDPARIAVVGPNRPRLPFATTDFWVQGLLLGLDCRY